jgi:myo-inositol-1(or 4)-monophosphatase
MAYIKMDKSQDPSQHSSQAPLSPSLLEALDTKLIQLGAEIMSRQKTASRETKSAPLDIVTESDLLVEHELKNFISQHRPDDGFSGEEKSLVQSQSGLIWYLDPIDGTLNYSRGDENYSISIGCARGDEPVFGATYFPARKEMFVATAKKGAVLNGAPLLVEPKEKSYKELSGEFCMMRSDPRIKECRYKLDTSLGYLFSYASATYATVHVAQGKMDFFVHTRPTVYDYAAVVTIAQEAGCYVAQDFLGTPVTLASGASPLVVCRTKKIASQLAELLGITKF